MRSPYSLLAAALLALSGCGAIEWREPAETEALLAAAGFHVRGTERTERTLTPIERAPWVPGNRTLPRA
jgi:hypothetical protein